jgi:hypothetical protein
MTVLKNSTKRDTRWLTVNNVKTHFLLPPVPSSCIGHLDAGTYVYVCGDTKNNTPR